MVIGSSTMPASERLTTSTWCAWSSIERLRWITPRPPCRAIATAIRASVTVSIGEEISGIFTEIRFDTRDAVSTSDGMTSLCVGLQQHVVEGQAERGERMRNAGRRQITGGLGHETPFARSEGLMLVPRRGSP